MTINWIIAFLGLGYYYIWTFRNRKNSENFSFETWISENADSLIASFIAVVTFMIILSDSTVQSEIGSFIESKGLLVKVLVFKLISLIVGLTNTWLMDLIFRTGKKKLANTFKSREKEDV